MLFNDIVSLCMGFVELMILSLFPFWGFVEIFFIEIVLLLWGLLNNTRFAHLRTNASPLEMSNLAFLLIFAAKFQCKIKRLLIRTVNCFTTCVSLRYMYSSSVG